MKLYIPPAPSYIIIMIINTNDNNNKQGGKKDLKKRYSTYAYGDERTPTPSSSQATSRSPCGLIPCWSTIHMWPNVACCVLLPRL